MPGKVLRPIRCQTVSARLSSGVRTGNTVHETEPKFELRRASYRDDVLAAQRLRYRVFVDELGGDGALVDHDQGLEIDRFDDYFDHLILFDHARPVDPLDRAVGVYRVMRQDAARRAGGFYSEAEYDLSVLENSASE